METHHTGAQRLAAVEVSRGQASVLRALAQRVLKGHECDNHVLTLALTRKPPRGQEYRPRTTKDPFARRIAAALAPLRELPPLPGRPDADFATLMQLHHPSGVALAQAELAFGKNAELKKAVRAIVRDGQQEIRQYQHWLRAHPVARPSNYSAVLHAVRMSCLRRPVLACHTRFLATARRADAAPASRLEPGPAYPLSRHVHTSQAQSKAATLRPLPTGRHPGHGEPVLFVAVPRHLRVSESKATYKIRRRTCIIWPNNARKWRCLAALQSCE